jgi:elongation factor 1 alpha-like protein
VKEAGTEKGLEWYEGPSLVDLIDNLDNPIRDLEGPVRFNIADVGQTIINSLQGFSVFGKLETGVINEEKEYIIMPNSYKVKLRAISLEKVNVRTSNMLAGQSGELLLIVDKSHIDEIKY